MVNAIFDAQSLYAKAYYAAQTIPEHIGNPNKVVELAVNMVFNILDPDIDIGRLSGTRIDRVLFAWDGAHNPLKKRAEKPQAYHDVRMIVRDVFPLVFGGATYEHPKYEADDIVATAACAHPEADTYIFSSDKDLMQLQDKNIHFYCLQTKAVLSQAYVCNKFHVKHPSHIAIALAIAGDSGDSIAGIKGWGPKKVQKLFEAVKPNASLEEALNVIEDQIPDDKKPEFYDALNRTLLNPAVPGVPDPAPIAIIEHADLLNLGISFDQEKYARITQAYDEIPYD